MAAWTWTPSTTPASDRSTSSTTARRQRAELLRLLRRDGRLHPGRRRLRPLLRLQLPAGLPVQRARLPRQQRAVGLRPDGRRVHGPDLAAVARCRAGGRPDARRVGGPHDGRQDGRAAPTHHDVLQVRAPRHGRRHARPKTVAKAEASLDRYLDDNATEDARLTFRMRLPAANVNDWKEGQYAQVRFSHLKHRRPRPVRVHERALRPPHRRPGRGDGRLLQRRLRVHADARRAVGRGRRGHGRCQLLGHARPCRGRRRPATCSWRSCSRPATRPASRPPSGPSTTRRSRPPAPATPPFSTGQTAAWTIIGSATTDYKGQNIGGPCGAGYGGPFHGAAGTCTSGLMVAAAWRHVAPGEVTTKPAQFSTEITDSQTLTFLWELPTPTPPDGTFVEADGTAAATRRPRRCRRQRQLHRGGQLGAGDGTLGAVSPTASAFLGAGSSLRGPIRPSPAAIARRT